MCSFLTLGRPVPTLRHHVLTRVRYKCDALAASGLVACWPPAAQPILQHWATSAEMFLLQLMQSSCIYLAEGVDDKQLILASGRPLCGGAPGLFVFGAVRCLSARSQRPPSFLTAHFIPLAQDCHHRLEIEPNDLADFEIWNYPIRSPLIDSAARDAGRFCHLRTIN
jgi:hypothetical protein